MKIIKHVDIEMAKSFLSFLFTESITESTDNVLHNAFIDNLKMHKILANSYSSIISALNLITETLINNSNLNIKMEAPNKSPDKFAESQDSYNKAVMLFSIAALSVCIMDEGKFLRKNKFNKNEYEIEIKSILEELQMSGIGNGLVKTLSKIYESIFNMSKVIFKSKSIYDSFNEPNLLKSIVLYIRRYKLSIYNFSDNFKSLSKTIRNIYLKENDLEEIKNKLSKYIQLPQIGKVLTINEFNI
jgi:DNA repair ATPase RecN